MFRERIIFSGIKVTHDEVVAAIKHETYTLLSDNRTTICQLTLANGFTVMGTSACVSVEEYNKELGEKYARQRAFDEAWKAMGAMLAHDISLREQAVDPEEGEKQ